MGVRHENLIGKGASRAVVDETLAAFRTWETGTRVGDCRGQPAIAGA